MNSLHKTVTRQRRGCDLNPGPCAPESSSLTTRPPSHPSAVSAVIPLCPSPRQLSDRCPLQVDITRMSLDDVVILMSIPRRLVLTVRTRKSCCSKNLSCPALLTPTSSPQPPPPPLPLPQPVQVHSAAVQSYHLVQVSTSRSFPKSISRSIVV